MALTPIYEAVDKVKDILRELLPPEIMVTTDIPSNEEEMKNIVDDTLFIALEDVLFTYPSRDTIKQNFYLKFGAMAYSPLESQKSAEMRAYAILETILLYLGSSENLIYAYLENVGFHMIDPVKILINDDKNVFVGGASFSIEFGRAITVGSTIPIYKMTKRLYNSDGELFEEKVIVSGD